MIPFTVREAPQGSTWGAEVLQMSGLEVLRASLERRLDDPPVIRLTGLRLSEVGLATASVWMPASAWWQSAAGSGIEFDDRGQHTLKGIWGQWHLYAARAA